MEQEMITLKIRENLDADIEAISIVEGETIVESIPQVGQGGKCISFEKSVAEILLRKNDFYDLCDENYTFNGRFLIKNPI